MTRRPAATSRPGGSRSPIDFARPRVACVYNAALQGSDNYGPDRLLLKKLQAAVPKVKAVFESEAAFVNRAVRYLAPAHHITQWVIAVPWSLPQPTVDRVDAVICGPDRDARIWFVERDPVTAAHLRALVGGEAHEGPVRIVEANPLKPDAMCAALREHRTPPDPGPICLVLGGVLSFHPGTRAEAAEVVQQHLAWLPAGSFVVLTHLLDPEQPELTPVAHALQSTLQQSGLTAGSVATRAEIKAMVSGARILEPGMGQPPDVVPASTWWRDGPDLKPEPSGQLVAAVVAAVDSS